MKARILIVEDDSRYAQRLASLLERIGYFCLKPVQDLDDFHDLSLNTVYDLAIVDIELGIDGNRDGEKIINHLRGKIPIIIHSEFNNTDTWKLTDSKLQIDQLGKMTDPDTWLAKINNMLNAFSGYSSQRMLTLPEGKVKGQTLVSEPRFYLRDPQNGGKICVLLRDLYYLRTDPEVRGRVIWYTTYGELLSTSKLDELEEQYRDYNFFRVHKSCIFNWSARHSIFLSENKIVINADISERSVPIGRRYRKALVQRMNGK